MQTVFPGSFSFYQSNSKLKQLFNLNFRFQRHIHEYSLKCFLELNVTTLISTRRTNESTKTKT